MLENRWKAGNYSIRILLFRTPNLMMHCHESGCCTSEAACRPSISSQMGSRLESMDAFGY